MTYEEAAHAANEAIYKALRLAQNEDGAHVDGWKNWLTPRRFTRAQNWRGWCDDRRSTFKKGKGRMKHYPHLRITEKTVIEKERTMSKFVKASSGYWVHEDLSYPVFSRKPPEWIADDIVRAYEHGYRHGKSHVQNSIREALDFLVPDIEE